MAFEETQTTSKRSSILPISQHSSNLDVSADIEGLLALANVPHVEEDARTLRIQEFVRASADLIPAWRIRVVDHLTGAACIAVFLCIEDGLLHVAIIFTNAGDHVVIAATPEARIIEEDVDEAHDLFPSTLSATANPTTIRITRTAIVGDQSFPITVNITLEKTAAVLKVRIRFHIHVQCFTTYSHRFLICSDSWTDGQQTREEEEEYGSSQSRADDLHDDFLVWLDLNGIDH